MSVDLPEPIVAYLAAENRHDTGALARCFTEDAVVRDEGQTFKGLADIKQWKAETKKKYQHTVEPLEAVQKDGETIVTNRLTGNFPGSPIDLKFVSRLEGGVFLNCGSAVILPEVFLKAVALARNAGRTLDGLTTVNLDFLRHYRPQTNVVARPTAGVGRGYSLVGHHEILIPLLAAALVDGLDG